MGKRGYNKLYARPGAYIWGANLGHNRQPALENWKYTNGNEKSKMLKVKENIKVRNVQIRKESKTKD